jgi:hypothetical protein
MNIVAGDEEIGVGVYEMQIKTLADEGGREGEEDEEERAKWIIEIGHLRLPR